MWRCGAVEYVCHLTNSWSSNQYNLHRTECVLEINFMFMSIRLLFSRVLQGNICRTTLPEGKSKVTFVSPYLHVVPISFTTLFCVYSTCYVHCYVTFSTNDPGLCVCTTKATYYPYLAHCTQIHLSQWSRIARSIWGPKTNVNIIVTPSPDLQIFQKYNWVTRSCRPSDDYCKDLRDFDS